MWRVGMAEGGRCDGGMRWVDGSSSCVCERGRCLPTALELDDGLAPRSGTLAAF